MPSIQLSVAIGDEAIGPEDIESLLWRAFRARFLSPLFTNHAVSTRKFQEQRLIETTLGSPASGQPYYLRSDRSTAEVFATLGIDNANVATY
jgi:hypothetical protein